jgi:sulfonate transport system permease protein
LGEGVPTSTASERLPPPPNPLPQGEGEFRRLRGWITALAVPVALGVAWELAVRTGIAPGRLMPPPSRLLHTAAALAASGELQRHVAATMTRVAVGFGVGAVAGTLMGMLTGASETARRLLDPSIQALRAIPSIAWVPIFILWLGIFETSKLALIALGVFFPVYLGTLSGVQSVDRKLVEVGRVFGFSPLGIMLRITWPAVLPTWIASLRSGLGLGFMFVVAAELMGASEGLGYLLLDGQQMGRADSILVAMIVFALLGKASDGVLVALARPLLRWQDTVRGRL